ncbi:MAG: protease SohB [Gammaproteobacteria bacterium]|nr:protease SohB [Gammaproteobacteria bacterium]
MPDILLQLLLFGSKALIILIIILIILITLVALLGKGKHKTRGKLTINHLNKKFQENTELILSETESKKHFKHYQKQQKAEEKVRLKENGRKHIFVLTFHGDMRASAVETLREEITAVLNVATPTDEVMVRLESAGGVVHAYGLAAAQLQRIRARNIPLTIFIDKVAASGGYLMACVANTIYAAPFAIIGSIGVVVQLPNFHRLLQDKHIDFEQYTAGEFKRTITVFGKNTEEGRKKLQEEIEDIHQLFKNLILDYRPNIDIKQVATGEYWLGQQALKLNLIDVIQTSDDYILEQSKEAELYEIAYEVKKPFLNKLMGSSGNLQQRLMDVARFKVT